MAGPHARCLLRRCAEARADPGLAEVFAGATDHAQAWQEALEEWDVNESPLVKRWRAEVRAEVLVESLEARFGKVPDSLLGGSDPARRR